MATETQMTKAVVSALIDKGAVVIPYCGSAMQPAGYPDRIVWDRRWCGWLEFKGPNTPLTTIQRARLRELRLRRHGSAWVFRFTKESTVAAWAGVIEDPEGELVSGPVRDADALLDRLAFLQRLDEEGWIKAAVPLTKW